jgi:hypothetical protein
MVELPHPSPTRFARAGVPLIKAQRILGLSDLKLTAAIYSHVEAGRDQLTHGRSWL